MKKIRVVFEAEVQQDTQLTPDVLRRVWSHYSDFSEDWLKDEWWLEMAENEQVLLSALLANPKLYQRFFFHALHSSLDMMPGELLQLAGENISDREAAEEPVEKAIDTLPEENAAYFHDAREQNTIATNTELVMNSLQINITGLRIEDI